LKRLLLLPTPTCNNGRWFLGWFSAASGGTKFGTGDSFTVKNGLVMYARFL